MRRNAKWSETGLAMASDSGFITSLGFRTGSALARAGGASTGSSLSLRRMAQPDTARLSTRTKARRIHDSRETTARHDLTGGSVAPASPQGDGPGVIRITPGPFGQEG